MNTAKDNYLAHVIELRDAGKQLMHLFADTNESLSTPEDKMKTRKHFLEAELYVLQLDEVIDKIGSRTS